MGNGFIVEIINNTNTVEEVKLFTDTLPNGMLVNSINNQFDFDKLKPLSGKLELAI